jgi:hypothetical protein
MVIFQVFIKKLKIKFDVAKFIIISSIQSRVFFLNKLILLKYINKIIFTYKVLPEMIIFQVFIKK